jgi:hypothetical protein
MRGAQDEVPEAEAALLPSMQHEKKAQWQTSHNGSNPGRRQFSIALLLSSTCLFVVWAVSSCRMIDARSWWQGALESTSYEDSTKGSKYLLGVGKADITG